MELLFDRDPLTRTVQTFHFDESTEKVTIEDAQDVQSIIDYNKAVQTDDGIFRRNRKSELRRVANVPLNVLFAMKHQWRDQGLSWEERQAAMKRWLNDSDNRFFRTDDSKV